MQCNSTPGFVYLQGCPSSGRNPRGVDHWLQTSFRGHRSNRPRSTAFNSVTTGTKRLFLEVGGPVRNQNERCGDAFRVGVEDKGLSVWHDIVGGSQRSCVLNGNRVRTDRPHLRSMAPFLDPTIAYWRRGLRLEPPGCVDESATHEFHHGSFAVEKFRVVVQNLLSK